MTRSRVAASRSINKTERQKRRDEIIDRWDRRVANRGCQAEIASGTTVTAALLRWSQWAPFEDLIEYVPPENLKVVLAHALRIIELKEMPYDEYLKTDYWQRVAARAKRAFDGCCALDASHPAEHAHHRTYRRRGREQVTDVIPLCADCHAKFHGRGA